MTRCHNPIDTPQQREHEVLALSYYRHPEIQAAREEIRAYWLDLAKPSAVMLRCFEASFDEVMFGAVIWAGPWVGRVFRAAGAWVRESL